MDSSKHRNDNKFTDRFHKACVNGDLEKVSKLLRKKEKIDLTRLEEKITLYSTLDNGHRKIVKILLEIGVDANEENGLPMSPLQLATLNREFKIVKLLLKHGADVNHENFEKVTPLHYACLVGHLKITKELLKYNPDVNAVDDNNFYKTPLRYAAFMGNNVHVVEELLNHGADIDFKDVFGTALHWAMQCEEGVNVDIVKMLLKRGCNTNIRAKLTVYNDELPMCTAFELALKMKSFDIVKVIAFHET